MAKLLVVDDEIGIRELLSEILTDEGHSVLTAEDAQTAREIIASQTLDLVLLDIWMPDCDGVTLLKQLVSSGTLRCPVIMMSGHATIDTAVDATKFGASDFLEKPISMQRLLSSVENALSRGKPETERTSAPQTAAGGAAAPAAPMLSPGSEAKAVIYRKGGQPLGEIPLSLPIKDARDLFEKYYLTQVLEEEGYAMSKVAARSGLERTHLYRKLKQLEIRLPAKGAQKPGS